MKPHLLKVITGTSQSFSVRQDDQPNINNRWHYHTELELIYFHKGSGTQFIGDNISRFTAGDVVLVGANLPHYWRFDKVTNADDKTPYSTVVHFTETFLGERFLNLPELATIKLLFGRAKRGILWRGQNPERKAAVIEAVYASEGLNRIMALLHCFSFLAQSNNGILLSSQGFQYHFSETENERLGDIYNYVLKNFHRKIYLEEIAAEAKLVSNSFCRYFKSRTGKTFIEFITEIRIGHACKLLLDDKSCLKKISAESGFNNFSCFHKSFKQITGKTPQEYKQAYFK